MQYKNITYEGGDIMNLLMIGAPGAGKGTQAVRLCGYLDIPHLSTGDIFRHNIKNETELGLKVKEIISLGKLVPDQITNEIVSDRISASDCSNGFLLDGYPRNVSQAEYLDEILSKKGQKIDAAINLIVEDEIILQRMTGRRVCEGCGASYHIVRIPTKVEGVCDKCGGDVIQREDDKHETVLNRLEVYHEQTEPIIKYYSNKGILKNVSGKSCPEETNNDILKVLGV